LLGASANGPLRWQHAGQVSGKSQAVPRSPGHRCSIAEPAAVCGRAKPHRVPPCPPLWVYCR